MKTETIHNTTAVYRSSKRPDVVTDERDLAAAIAWADQPARSPTSAPTTSSAGRRDTPSSATATRALPVASSSNTMSATSACV